MKKNIIIGTICVVILGIGIFFLPKLFEDVGDFSEPELQEICTEKSWPPECKAISDLEGRNLCEKCKELMGEEVKEEVKGGLIKEEDITQLTFLDNLVGDPSWSPDGSKLVFLGLEKSMMKGGLYIMNDDGTGLFKIEGQWERDHLFNPSWNPISNKIICHGSSFGQGPGGKGLYLVDLDGDQTKRTELSSQIVEHGSWNHDGKKITYNVYNEDRSFSSIWVMNADGSEKTQLTTKEDDFCTGPSFSYDGSKIVYLKGFTTSIPGPKPKEAINEIWVMNNDGSDKHMIYAPGEGMQLIRERAWNKNDEIIFAKHIYQGAPQIWVINSDGTNPKCIFNPEEEGIPTAIYDDAVWDNSGTKVAVTKVILSDESWQIAVFSWKK
jgi:Tol biopolymer transport system component